MATKSKNKSYDVDALEHITRQDFMSSPLYMLEQPTVILWKRKPTLVLLPIEFYEELLHHQPQS